MKTSDHNYLNQELSGYNYVTQILKNLYFNQKKHNFKKWVKHKNIGGSGIFFNKKSHNIPELFVTSRSKSNTLNQVLKQFSKIQPLSCDYKILTTLLNIIKIVCVLITDFFHPEPQLLINVKKVI